MMKFIRRICPPRPAWLFLNIMVIVLVMRFISDKDVHWAYMLAVLVIGMLPVYYFVWRSHNKAQKDQEEPHD